MLSGSTKIASSSKANTSNAFDEVTSQSYHKAKALSSGVKIASSGVANASNAYGEAKPKAKHLAFTMQNLTTKAKSKAFQGAVQPKGIVL